MDLQNSIHYRLDNLFKDFLQTIADHYNIDFNDLCTFADSINLDSKAGMTCMHKMINGINRGKLCPNKALDNGYCGKHQNSASSTIGTIINKTKKATEKIKGMTKTQLQIVEWLNTAVPQEETVLKKRSKGLHHEETDIIFDEDHKVIGKINNDKIVTERRVGVDVLVSGLTSLIASVEQLVLVVKLGCDAEQIAHRLAPLLNLASPARSCASDASFQTSRSSAQSAGTRRTTK